MLVALLSLFGCASTTSPYHPLGANNREGYKEIQLENNRFSVAFNGGRNISQQELEAYLLYRAAEITLEQNKDYFIASGKQVKCDDQIHSFQNFDNYYGWGYYRYNSINPIWHSTQCSANANILLFSGDKPTSDINAYDARTLIEHLNKELFNNKQESE